MPTHLKCVHCRRRFYTATGHRYITRYTCQTCGGRLAVLCEGDQDVEAETNDAGNIEESMECPIGP